MEVRYGVQGTVVDGIFFTENEIAGALPMKHVSVEISRQNSNLTAVKQRMATEAKALGATALMNFRYGQRAHRGIKLLLPKWDTESWHGEGDAVMI